jgi:hypothetical protein
MDKKITIYHQLNTIYNELENMNENSINEVVEMLKGINFEAVIDYFNTSEKLDDMDLYSCRKIVQILQYIYNNTDIIPPVSDEKYDILYQIMIDHKLGDIVGSVNSQGKPVREHMFPDLRGTLNKVHFVFNIDKDGDKRRSIEDWITSVTNILGRDIDNSKDFEVILQAKWDGCSAVFECDKFGVVKHVLMRGDTEKNQAVDIIDLFRDNIRFSEFANGEDEFAVQTEILMNQEDYEQIPLLGELITGVDFLKEGDVCEVVFDTSTETVLYAELPIKTVLEVTYTEPGEKGNTATNAMKDATVETGASVRVPLFINTGDKIRIDTRTGEYTERVK